jgi:hypothetical protein
MKRENLLFLGLLALGLANMVSDLTGALPLRALSSATGASPAPKVFSTMNGVEGYSTQFFLDWEVDGETVSLELTPERYAKLQGAYNRRNVFGAVIAGAPTVATNPHFVDMFRDITRHGLCGEQPLLQELGVTAEGPVTIRLVPRKPLTGTPPLTFAVRCDE